MAKGPTGRASPTQCQCGGTEYTVHSKCTAERYEGSTPFTGTYGGDTMNHPVWVVVGVLLAIAITIWIVTAIAPHFNA